MRGQPATPSTQEVGGVAEPARQVRPPTETEKLQRELLDVKLERFAFDEQPLDEVLGHLQLRPELDGVNFILDPDELRNERITRGLQNVTLRSALKAMLQPRGYDFAVWCEAIYISTPENVARRRLEEAYERAGLALPVIPDIPDTRTDAEKELDRVLETPIKALAFDDQPLDEVITYFRLMTEFERVNFFIDRARLLMMDEVFISLELRNVTLRQALDRMLRPRGLDWINLGDVIFISTVEGCAAEEIPSGQLVFLSYDVRDIAALSGDLPDANAVRRLLFKLTGDGEWSSDLWHGREDDLPGPAEDQPFKDLDPFPFPDLDAPHIILVHGSSLLVNHLPEMHRRIQSILTEIRRSQPLPEAVPLEER